MITNPSINQISVMGCGWYGMPFAIRMARSGFQVHGSTTTEKKREVMQSHNIQDYVISLDPGLKHNGDADRFFNTDVLVLNIPPGRGKPGAASRYRLMMDNLLPHITASSVQLLIFISSTSVYPDCNKVVKEDDAGQGDISESGKILLETEQMLQSRKEFKTTVLRFGGLYGPDRHPVRYMAGKEDLANPEAPVNLVHLEDCIRVTERVIRQQVTNEVFNVVSDEHPGRERYYTETARRFGLTRPTFKPASDTDRWKQISNRKLKEILKYRFKYPSPYEGG